MIALVAGQLGVASAVAQTVVNVILNAGTLVTVLGIVATLVSGGAGAILTMGWATFKATVKKLAKKSMAKAIAW